MSPARRARAAVCAVACAMFPAPVRSRTPIEDRSPITARSRRPLLAAMFASALLSTAAATGGDPAHAQQRSGEFVPQVGQAGKDVVWVPTPDYLVDRMLRMAQVTPEDFVMDLGAGDGKIVIAAAKNFKARAKGIEFNPDMVELGQRNARSAGVGERATIEQGDIFKTDLSAATVITMYLLPVLNMQLRPSLLKLKPGTRLVTHEFNMGEWDPDEISWVEGRRGLLWIVPANAGGQWKLTYRDPAGQGSADVTLEQAFQRVKGSARFAKFEASLREPTLRGQRLQFELRDDEGTLRRFEGEVGADKIQGTTTVAGGATGTFTATRVGEAPPIRESKMSAEHSVGRYSLNAAGH